MNIRPYLLLGSMALLLTMCTSPLQAPPAGGARRPFPQHVVYAPDTMRPNHRTQAQQDDDVRAAYDRWKGHYLLAAGNDAEGNPFYRVAFGKAGTDNHAVTVSEGQGYGMVIVAHMAGHDPDARTIFDGLWRFARAHPSSIEPRLMSWRVESGRGGNSSAFDGDADIAYGLLVAGRQWGSDGDIDYTAEAKVVITAIAETMIGLDSHLPLLGDWIENYGPTRNQYTPRSSDFMPAHFRAFRHASADQLWDAVITASQRSISLLQERHSPNTGLLPDFIEPVSATDHDPRPAEPGFLEGDNDGSYAYNAGRVPWRIGTDALLHNDATSRAQAQKIAAWSRDATGGVPTNIKPGYRLDGTPIPPGNFFTTFFAAPLGVAAMTLPPEPGNQAWLNAIYDSVRDASLNYYEDTVSLYCMLIMTGNFWDTTR
jgi:endoglucanase